MIYDAGEQTELAVGNVYLPLKGGHEYMTSAPL
jgi:hypothetical protein